MSDTPPERPTMPDDLDQAYAKAHAIADAARGPSAAVRVNVLAAAREIAARAAVRSDGAFAPPAVLTPVAPPVAAVGRGRLPAVNLASWRVRAGAAFCAALLVGVVGWRIDASRRFSADTQLAAAATDTPEMKVVPPAPPQAALDAAPAPPQASVPASPADVATMANAASPEAAARPAARAKDLVVAQAGPPLHARARSLAQDDARARERKTAASPAAQPEPVVVASLAPAPVAPQITTTSVMPAPAPEPRLMRPAAPAPMVPEPPRVAFAAAAPAREQMAGAAASDAQRVEITGSSIARSAPVSDASRVALDSARKSAPASAGTLLAASARRLPTPLQTAADQGDVETLKTLLANPATRVDAPDATGRTALLHAVLAQQAAAVRLLIAAGADPGHADDAGLTPRAAALAGASAEIATLLDAPR